MSSAAATAALHAATGPHGIELLTTDAAELWEAAPLPTHAAAAAAGAAPPQLTTKLAHGRLTVLLVTIDVEDPPATAPGNADVWLVLTVRDDATASDRPFPVLASQRVVAHRPTHSYRFINPPHQGLAQGTSDIVLKLAARATDQKTPFDLDPTAEAYLEDILAQYCAFEEPADSEPPPPFSTSSNRGGPATVGAAHSNSQGEIELFDEDGKLIGHLEGTFDEHPDLKRAALSASRGNDAKNPVLIDISNARSSAASGSTSGTAYTPTDSVRVSPLQAGEAEAFQQQAGEKEEVDWMIHSAQFIGRSLVKGSIYLGSRLNSAAEAYIERNPSKHSAASTPRTGSPAPIFTDVKGAPAGYSASPTDASAPPRPKLGATVGSSTSTSTSPGADARAGLGAHSRYERTQTGATSKSHFLTKYSSKAVAISHSTTTAILGVASEVGDRVGKATGIQRQQRPDGTLGPPPKGVRGFLNRGIIAASSLLDSIEQAGENLVSDGGSAASRVIGHKYGPDAERRAGNVASSGMNVYMVYKDIMGVRRRCLIKAAVGSSMKARTPEGELVEVKLGPGGGSGTITPAAGGAGPAGGTRA